MGIPPEAPGLILLAVAAVLAPARAARTLGAGIIAIAFGTASARVALSLPPVAALGATTLMPLPMLSRTVDGGVALAGLLAIVLALPAALRQVSRRMQWTLVLLLLAGFVIAADATTDLVRSAGWLRAFGAALVAGSVVAVIFSLASRPFWARLAARLRSGLAGPLHALSPDRVTRLWLVLATGGAALAVAAPHALVVLAGAALASLALHIAMRRMRDVGIVPLLPLVVIPLLVFEAHYLRVIAGPVGLAMRDFADVPLSSAAQVALAPPLIVAALLFGGPLPGRRWLPGSALAIVGVALLVRIGHPLLGDALLGWETLFLPPGLLLLWLAALAGAWEAGAGTAAWLVATIVAPAATEGAVLLAVAALLLAIRRRAGPPQESASRVLLLLAAGSGAAGLACGMAAMLQHQVVYGVLGVVAALVLVGGAGNAGAMIYSAGSPDPTAFSGAAHGIHPSSSSI